MFVLRKLLKLLLLPVAFVYFVQIRPLARENKASGTE